MQVRGIQGSAAASAENIPSMTWICSLVDYEDWAPGACTAVRLRRGVRRVFNDVCTFAHTAVFTACTRSRCIAPHGA